MNSVEIATPPEARPPRKLPVWLWPHVLSLEAPAVAVLWALALGRLHSQPWWPGVLPGLALCVWFIYLLDRTLDTFVLDATDLGPRHRIYLRARPFILGILLPACVCSIGWLALWVIPAGLMWQCVALAFLVFFYLALYSGSSQRRIYVTLVSLPCAAACVFVVLSPLPLTAKLGLSAIALGLLLLMVRERTRERLRSVMPKQMAAGLLFTLGCTTWPRFVASGWDWLGGSMETLLLTALFTCNLTGISAREREAATDYDPRGDSHRAADWHPGLLRALVTFSIITMALANANFIGRRFLLLGVSTALGGAMLMGLHAKRRGLSPDCYRVLADVAVAAAALFLYLSAGTSVR